MVQSSPARVVLLEVDHDSAVKRWLLDVMLPSDYPSPLDTSGKVVIAQSERGARSRCRYSSNGGSNGKICVCETFDDLSAKEAMMFASKAGARVLLVTHPPDELSEIIIPVIMISGETLEFIKCHRSAKISAVELSGSYTCLDVTFRAQKMSGEPDQSLQWKSKMVVNNNLIKKTTSSLECSTLVQAQVFRDNQNNLESFADEHSRTIPILHATHPNDVHRAVKLASEIGADALFVCGETGRHHDWSPLPIPVVTVDHGLLDDLKRAGLLSGELFVEIFHDNGPASASLKSPEVWPRLPMREDPPLASSHGQGRKSAPDPPGAKKGLLGNFKAWVNVFIGYSPKSGDEFNAIIRKEGSPWSYDSPRFAQFREAMVILDRIIKVDILDNQQAELGALIDAVSVMTQEQNFVGDVLVLLFCGKILSLQDELEVNVSRQKLQTAMMTIVRGIIIDPELPSSPLSDKDKGFLDHCIKDLTKFVSNQKTAISKHKSFVQNSLWIRTYYCAAFEGTWQDLRRVTSLEHIADQQDILLSFMTPVNFNTLVITSIAHDMVGIIRFFSGNDAIPVAVAALKTINRLLSREVRGRQVDALTALDLIGHLVVEHEEDEMVKKDAIQSVIGRASFGSVRTFEGLDAIVTSLPIQQRNFDMIIEEITDSIFVSLRKKGYNCPLPSHVSTLLRTKTAQFLVTKEGWQQLTSFARQSHSKEGIFELFGHMHDLFVRKETWTDDESDITNELLDCIRHCVSSSTKKYKAALEAFQTAYDWHGIFTGTDHALSVCKRLAKLIVSETGVASTIRCSPSSIFDLPTINSDESPGLLFGCLHKELMTELMSQCSRIEDAVSFCRHINTSASSDSDVETITSNIILNGFSNWNPSTMSELLRVDETTLVNAHKLLKSLTTGDINKGEDFLKRGRECVSSMTSIIDRWLAEFSNDSIDEMSLTEVSDALTERKRGALVELFHPSEPDAIPHRRDLREKIDAINECVQSIRSMLTFTSDKDEYTTLDLVSAYDINTVSDSFIPCLIEKYFSKTSPNVSLAELGRDRTTIDLFLQQSLRELQASAHFLKNKSVLFHQMVGFGTWPKIDFDEFLAKISSALDRLVELFSPRATFTDISEASSIISEENACVESELGTVCSCPGLDIDYSGSQSRLLHVMVMSTATNPLKNFVACCQTLNFQFVTLDRNFSELADLSERLHEGAQLDVDECFDVGLRIADLISTVSGDLRRRLETALPTLQFFDTLRYCSAVFVMAKERGWFGGEGLKSFYEEYTNVSNIFKSDLSFENEVLDRLEPTIRAISAVGGMLASESMSPLFTVLQDNLDICKLQEMRTVQANIFRIRDWFSEGMDDVAAILGKFSLIQSSGVFTISTATRKASLSLSYLRSQAGENEATSMTEKELKDLVQYLSFMNKEGGDSSNAVSAFIETFQTLSLVAKNKQRLLDVGFSDASVSADLEHVFCNPESQSSLGHQLEESERKLNDCHSWLKAVRSSHRHSLLFWMEELRHLSNCVSKLRGMCISGKQDVFELEATQEILEVVSKLSPEVSQHPESLGFIIEHVRDASLINTGWLEDASILITKFGEFAETLGLPCFKAVEPVCHKKMTIHKINCSNEMAFAAPLHLLKGIYKSRCPASFEVLDGASTRSPDAVKLFLDRALAFPSQTFTIIGVDELPVGIQEIIANFLTMYSRSEDGIHLHCIQSRHSILHAPPGVEVRLWGDSLLDSDRLTLWLKEHIIAERRVNNVTVVCGPAGSGKTRHIREAMNALATTKGATLASVHTHEDFCLAKAIASLKSSFKCGTTHNRAIHVGLSTTGGVASKDILLSVNTFFNTFLLLQDIYDSSSGVVFHGSRHSYDIFVELDCENESLCHEWLCQRVPILASLSDINQPPADFFIDDQTRRVCTYLRAFGDGTINRKFNPASCNKRIFFVLDNSESMEIESGDRSCLEVATDCMLSIFDSHLQLMDHIGLITFNTRFEVLVPLQRIEDEEQRRHLRNVMYSARHNPRHGTNMYTALSHALHLLQENNIHDDTYIICLTDGDADDSEEVLLPQLQNSPNNLHIITVGVNLEEGYHVEMKRLCNKYQNVGEIPNNRGFFLPTTADMDAIERAFAQVASRIPVSQTFELDGTMSEEECRAKLDEYRPDFIDPRNKLLYSFWVNFLYRRVSVFDQNDEFNYNEEYDSLGSSLMQVMLSESNQMLRREQNCWASSNHTQLIYDFTQQDRPQFRLICTSPEELPAETRDRLSELNLPGFSIPTTSDLRRRHTLDRYLSQALSIPMNEGPDGTQRLECIDDNRYVLTLDFTLKLLNIHERVSCGVPCLMEGETGVSKTALTKMYSILINSHQQSDASLSTMEVLREILSELGERFPTVVLDTGGDNMVTRIKKYLEPSPQHSSIEACRVVRDLIYEACLNRSPLFAELPTELDMDNGEKSVPDLLTWFSESHLVPTFFDINVHGALTAEDIDQKVDEARLVAQRLSSLNVKVVVFFDEINTSSVLGLLKEVVVDRSLNGVLLQENIVVVGACNPVRESTILQVQQSREVDLGREWASGHYQVKRLPPSLNLLAWDFGSLGSNQEKEFIHRRILMMDEPISEIMVQGMTEVISTSHELIRKLARSHIASALQNAQHGSDTDDEAMLRARSVVSLRDIQRVFHLFRFFLREFPLDSDVSDSPERFRRAMLLSVGVVYYLRLDPLARENFEQQLSSLPSEQYEELHLKPALESAFEAVMEQTEIPPGIAITSGLKENVFMTLCCTLSRTPLMIIGPPGCSKTLAVSVMTDNANGEESRGLFYQKLARVQPFHYQCSKSSTSKEVASVFDRAMQRQSKMVRSKQQCLVFMDEAGLPEEERESLKVLHYLLEGHMSATPEVGFVCITNHILDAAKSNRCVCLLRPEPGKDELMAISMGVLGATRRICFDSCTMTQEEFCATLCKCYLSLLEDQWFIQFFGLRDFIYFLKHIRRSSSLSGTAVNITTEVLLHALERNFSGVDRSRFAYICTVFLATLVKDHNSIKQSLQQHLRHPMDVLRNALTEKHLDGTSRFNLPRYKMIIDSTNDDSIMRLLRTSGILDSSHAFFQLSRMDEGAETEQLNLVSRVKYAAQQGDKTVVMSQIEDVSECLYDLFNQHFKEIKQEGKTLYFANIAIGGISRPCIIHPSFQCIVHVQSNQLDEIPAPFLNRFEKFELSVGDILSWKLSKLPLGVAAALEASLKECQNLLSCMGKTSVWSRSPDETLKSLFINMISSEPPVSYSFDDIDESNNLGRQSISVFLFGFVQRWLDVDISLDDIQRSIETALSELKGLEKLEVRKTMEECLDQNRVEESIHELGNSAKMTSPLARTMDLILRVSIKRYVIFQLLQVMTPQELFLLHNFLPKDILRAYFGGSQDHFSLKAFLSKTSESPSQLYMLHVHSDSSAHSLPTWCPDPNDVSAATSQSETMIRNILHENPSSLEVHHIDLLKSESKVRSTINSWVAKESVNSFILVVDMQLRSSSNLVNFIRAQVDGLVDLAAPKRFFLLLHYPLSSERPSYPALFLGKWQCVYLDGIGYHGFSGRQLPINDIFVSAFSEQSALRADLFVDSLMPRAAQYIASQVPFYQCSSHPTSVNRDMQFTERLCAIEAIFRNQVWDASLGMLLMNKYLGLWSRDALGEMLQHLAQSQCSGNTQLSLSSAVRSTFQHSFNKFLANSILDINMWANLDILECPNPLTDNIFALVLGALPSVPLKELMLQRDVGRRLNPLPFDVRSTKARVSFPFYCQVASFIDMALDKVSPDSEYSSWDDVISFQNSITRVSEMLDALLDHDNSTHTSIDASMVEIVKKIIGEVEMSPDLFEKYLSHKLLWKFGIEKNLFQSSQWISNKLNNIASSARMSPHNLVLLHIVCRVNVVDIIRISSWDIMEDTSNQLEQHGPLFEGMHFLQSMISHFSKSLIINSNKKEWSCSVFAFVQSIPHIIGDDTKLDDEAMIVTLRQLIFLGVIIDVNAPDRLVSEIHEEINGSTTQSSINDFLELLPDDNDETRCVSDAREKLLRVFFSPWWLRSVTDFEQGDAKYLVASIKTRHLEHQMALVHLRSLLLAGARSGKNKVLLPTLSFGPSAAILVNRNLTCERISEFDQESNRRKAMPHYIPPWLGSDTEVTPQREAADDISWFFNSYRNDFGLCPLADTVFDIMIGIMFERVRSSGYTSETLFPLIERAVHEERSVKNVDQIRRARLALQPGDQSNVSFIGSCLGAIEADALIVCFVHKIAEEFSISSQSSVLQSLYSDSAMRALDRVMGTHHWCEMLFSVVLKMRGEAHLVSLLSEGGVLNSFEWCDQWKQGISSLQQDIMADLNECERNLRAAREDLVQFQQQYRSCPYCRGLFGIDETNCGQFTCGRDAHGVMGQPAIGGQAVRGTFGCGRTFTLDQTLPYNQSHQAVEDQAALRELERDYENKRQALDEFKNGAELRRRAREFKIPPYSFHAQSGANEFVPSVSLVDYMPERETNPGTRLIVNTLRQLPRLEHLTYLPDMIELYIFLHRTFRYIVDKDQAMTLRMGEVMDEQLLANRFGSVKTARLRQLWTRVVEGVNLFLGANDYTVNWDCEEVPVPFQDVAECSLMFLLSEMDHPTDGHDYLFLMINELILRYCDFVNGVSALASLGGETAGAADELHPRLIVCASNGSFVLNSAVSNTKDLIDNLVESYWVRGESRFNTEGLNSATLCDIGMLGRLQPIKNPLSFLREKFAFREDTRNAPNAEEIKACFRSSDGLFFARNEDLSLYEVVKESAKSGGFVQKAGNSIRHTVIVTLLQLSYADWTQLLEGLRCALSREQTCDLLHGGEPLGAAIRGIGLQTIGFPASLDDTQLNFLNSITKDDMMELISVCGEQIASEAFRFVGTSSCLAEPMPLQTADSLREGVMRLLKSNSSMEVVALVDGFCEGVLEYYCDAMIAPECESSNEGLCAFLKRSNCCEDSDEILAAIPHSVTIRNYVDVRKVLYQLKLQLVLEGGKAPTRARISNELDKGKYQHPKWRWIPRSKADDDTSDESEKGQNLNGLWFEDALLKSALLCAKDSKENAPDDIDDSNWGGDQCEEECNDGSLDDAESDVSTGEKTDNDHPNILAERSRRVKEDSDTNSCRPTLDKKINRQCWSGVVPVLWVLCVMVAIILLAYVLNPQRPSFL